MPSPLSGKGLGADNFSWTAALVIDLLSEEKELRNAEPVPVRDDLCR